MFKRSNTPIILLSIVLLFSVVSFAAAQRPVRIKFARGVTRASVTGTLNGYRDKRDYTIRVKAGQTLKTEQVIMRRGSGSITIYITDPTGGPGGDSDMSCNNRHEITPTVAGDYQIQVVECPKADRWRGTFQFRVSVR